VRTRLPAHRDLRDLPRRHRDAGAAPRPWRRELDPVARIAASEVSRRPRRPGARRVSVRRLHGAADRGRHRLSEAPGGVMLKLDARIPGGPIEQKWLNAKFEMKLVNPANKRKYKVIVVGSGLAGGAAAATLAELGYNVACFCFQDSPRRAHSIAAQGGINAAKNYQNDGDSIHRLFYDTVKGGDFRAREANVHRLAEVSVDIID